MHVDTIRIQLNNLEDTEKLGRLLGSLAEPGDVICLDGDLGTGKTALSQAIARGLDVPDTCYVTSPSFAILHEYEGRLPMYHMDFYRLQDAGEVEDLGFDEYFYLTGLTVIEWSNRAMELLPDERIILVIVQNDDLSRTVTLKGTRRYAEMMQCISREFEDRAV
ncbi:MAG: tRNA (adenosine(37)-N6)-threonylcarbamoyltransferase complex ATPase subunit type 1 TsaE [Desulfobulbaceae bacterium]|nr:tRNA (adenosine(37)-N6)-threonylcarbamoyltransferase complex ATPase subunit type 1 TsaE [Desulfobulbaceae bacterium]